MDEYSVHVRTGSEIEVSLRGYLKKLGLFLLLSSLAVYFYIFNVSAGVRLTLDVASAKPSVARLFYDVGRGYQDDDSRSVPVSSTSIDSFRRLEFELPGYDIWSLRFDPLASAGAFAVKNVAVRWGDHVLLRIPASDIVAFRDIAARVQHGDAVYFTALPGATGPSLTFKLRQPLSLKRAIRRQRFHSLFAALSALLAVSVLLIALRGGVCAWIRVLSSPVKRIDAAFGRSARSVSSPEFLTLDSRAIWFYAACLAVFTAAVGARLNGSSAGMYPSGYRHGAGARIWIGEPRSSRADEWSYVTPDILNQYFRADRFETVHSEMGGHSAALTGNIPVRHASTLFRPQYWAFFFLPIDYAFAFYWQSKALLLVLGVFTWLLLLTRSTFWSATGSLWYFFSPFTQWSYSWPSALPEMIGLLCLGTVFACYLTVGRSKLGLLLASAGTAICAIDFAICAYVPHMIPLFWVAALFFVAWSIANWRDIVRRQGLALRIAAVVLTVLVVAAVGLYVYRDLQQALIGIANTVYPGRRIVPGGSTPLYFLVSHFMQWSETEQRVPLAVGNICEGSGFLWLAPLALICLSRLSLTKFQKLALASLSIAFCLLVAWLIFPVPASVGSILGLNRTFGARVTPALGLANVAIVVLCAATMRANSLRIKTPWIRLAAAAAGFAMLWLALHWADGKLAAFFTGKQVLFAALFTTVLVFLFLSGWKLTFAMALVLPSAIVFGAANPVEQGMGVFTKSELHQFVRQNPQLLNGKWIMFSDSVVNSGFLAATGCDVYTGTHYLPDVDHFPVFAAHGLDLQTLNRSGYLDAHLRGPEEKMRLERPSPVVVQWDVSPADPILKELGIKYAAFDRQPSADLLQFMEPLASKPVDGFWLYQLR
ncbi:MAG: hypothetical protein JOY54_18140 [Acidobacteriaceae bacterium]|nr:hypothetical protein [Acidobacteriaceae bacterium]